MSDNSSQPNFWAPSNNNSGWSSGIGGAIGGALGAGGLGGLFGGGANRGNAVTPDQLQASLSALQGQVQRDQLLEQIGNVNNNVTSVKDTIGTEVGNSTRDITGSIARLNDNVTAGNAATQMALCNLGHNMTHGFSNLGQTVTAGFAGVREQALEQSLQQERQRATDLRIELSENRARALQSETHTVIQNTINAGGANGVSAVAGQVAPALSQLTAAVSQIGQLVLALHGDVAKIRGTIAP